MKEHIIERIESLKKENEDNNKNLVIKKRILEKEIERNSQNGEKEMEALAGKFIDSVNVRIGIVKGRMEEIDNEIIFLKKLLKIDMDN